MESPTAHAPAPKFERELRAEYSCLETPVISEHRLQRETLDGSPDPWDADEEPYLVLRNPEETGERSTDAIYSRQFLMARKYRARILQRLEEEEEDDLANKLRKCGDEVRIHCTGCGHVHTAERRCSLKWCPVCQRKRATQRALRYERAATEMQWPMHVTLTRANVDAIGAGDIAALRAAFKQLRRREIWRKNVVGGITSIELTNTGKGWHPHVHVLADCEWLAIDTPSPKKWHSRAHKKQLYKRAQQELHAEWCSCIGQMLSSIAVRRCDGVTAVREVLKYAVKGSDLADSPDAIGPAIRAISAGRLCTPFGSLYGKRLVSAAEKKPPLPCPKCTAVGAWMPEFVVDGIFRASRRTR
jgi:hypothetical protein